MRSIELDFDLQLYKTTADFRRILDDAGDVRRVGRGDRQEEAQKEKKNKKQKTRWQPARITG